MYRWGWWDKKAKICTAEGQDNWRQKEVSVRSHIKQPDDHSATPMVINQLQCHERRLCRPPSRDPWPSPLPYPKNQNLSFAVSQHWEQHTSLLHIASLWGGGNREGFHAGYARAGQCERHRYLQRSLLRNQLSENGQIAMRWWLHTTTMTTWVMEKQVFCGPTNVAADAIIESRSSGRVYPSSVGANWSGGPSTISTRFM